MINYELARALRDAGFPQELKRGYLSSGKTPVNQSIIAAQCYFPTLEELIWACEPYLFKIVKTPLSKWEVEVSQRDTPIIYAQGSTPSEAVANLWLALNKQVDNPAIPK